MRGKLCLVADLSTELAGDGGDRRDRTDDLKLAKLPLSQLSYVPDGCQGQGLTCQIRHLKPDT
jgi:hypothetical protein